MKYKQKITDRLRLQSVFSSMKQRCYATYHRNYPHYGGRGIVICEEWLTGTSEAFVQWGLANGYAPGLQIDRRDNDKSYSPDNCRFVTPSTNNNNRSVSLRVESDGELKLLKEAVEVVDSPVSYHVAYRRLKKGWSPEDALTTAVKKGQKPLIVQYKGVERVFQELYVERFGAIDADYRSICQRITKYGWDAEKALSTALKKYNK